MRTSILFCKETSKVINTCWVYSQIWRGVCNTYNPLLLTSHFPGLLKQDFALLRRSIKLIGNVCGLSFSHLTNLVCERHIKASSDFAEQILVDSEHPLHEELSKTRSHTSTRTRFKLLPWKTAAYRNSVLPACHGCWLTTTLNWTTICRIFLEVYSPLPLTHFHYCTTFPPL